MITGPSRYFSCPDCEAELSFADYINRTLCTGTLFSVWSRHDHSLGSGLSSVDSAPWISRENFDV